VRWLPPNSIIGLNPPYGLRGELARQFIDRALRFQPRLLALIVPDSTVSQLTSASNAWLRSVKERLASDPALRGWQPPPPPPPGYAGAGWAPPRHPVLDQRSMPQYVLVAYNAHATSGASFYMPASHPQGRAPRGTGDGGGASGGGAASGGGSSGGVVYDLSGDILFRDGQPARYGGGGAGGSGGGLSNRQGLAMGGAAAAQGGSLEELEQRGMLVGPEEAPSFVLFARKDVLWTPSAAVMAPESGKRPTL
jgi:hypothetical protein